MNIKQKKIKIEPRIKLNYNIYANNFILLFLYYLVFTLHFMKREISVRQERLEKQ